MRELLNEQEKEIWRAEVDRQWEERQRKSLKLRRQVKIIAIVCGTIYLVCFVLLIVGVVTHK